MSDDAKRHREHTDYSDEQVGRAIVVQLVFEQGDLCVEQDRVWSGLVSLASGMVYAGLSVSAPMCRVRPVV
jgi:hypothetical protein